MTQVKICGLTTPDALTAALETGADFIGLVFHPASPRFVEIEVAAYLSQYVPKTVQITGLFVDMPIEKMTEILDNVRIDLIQLHGHETPEDIVNIRKRFHKPVMKALSISDETDLAQIRAYDPVCDWLLLDAKGTSDMPGGNGLAFDWKLLKGLKIEKPWMLAGGLTPETVTEAIKATHPTAVDVSSGVEKARGIKDPDKIRAFIKAAKAI